MASARLLISSPQVQASLRILGPDPHDPNLVISPGILPLCPILYPGLLFYPLPCEMKSHLPVNPDEDIPIHSRFPVPTLVRIAGDEVYTKYRVDDTYCQSILSNYTSMNTGYPYQKLGADLSSDEQIQMALFLARKYMADFKSTHCTPLPMSIFLRGV
ncbi:hypothetical protein M8J76_015414 [Diaphorina citri]|nr:hypothetical protein M8J76_015414 [Diaphorina citri]KAI5734361.1 hypothetical protein M8J77_005515 [Diaphorina citri]